MLSPMLSISILLFYMILGCLSAYIADKKNRNVIGWFLAGAFFGFIGLIILLLLPARQNNSSDKLREDPFDNSYVFDDLQKKLEDEKATEEDKLTSAQDLKEVIIDTEKWFYLDKARKTVGPLSFENLILFLKDQDYHSKAKTVPEEIWVWKKGMEDWKRTKNVTELQQALKTSK
ncbi:hypothetical protein C10C_0909 [Chlamydia serpentis]|uniref:GYF domain-containing protein n=1 Tax=Chlamydia serpentis TaxID=1967782 RepID=A0A2R8FCK6_9CHLA|nr:DUF4339 domain-containing protein [Chlamydia serpentis]SPN74046.1 hypothetical protein C10C_0909 [Chlamydia serpentis]